MGLFEFKSICHWEKETPIYCYRLSSKLILYGRPSESLSLYPSAVHLLL